MPAHFVVPGVQSASEPVIKGLGCTATSCSFVGTEPYYPTGSPGTVQKAPLVVATSTEEGT
jgi:hypothetical protein